jgi:hypothetical protein
VSTNLSWSTGLFQVDCEKFYSQKKEYCRTFLRILLSGKRQNPSKWFCLEKRFCEDFQEPFSLYIKNGLVKGRRFSFEWFIIGTLVSTIDSVSKYSAYADTALGNSPVDVNETTKGNSQSSQKYELNPIIF